MTSLQNLPLATDHVPIKARSSAGHSRTVWPLPTFRSISLFIPPHSLHSSHTKWLTGFHPQRFQLQCCCSLLFPFAQTAPLICHPGNLLGPPEPSSICKSDPINPNLALPPWWLMSTFIGCAYGSSPPLDHNFTEGKEHPIEFNYLLSTYYWQALGYWKEYQTVSIFEELIAKCPWQYCIWNASDRDEKG